MRNVFVLICVMILVSGCAAAGAAAKSETYYPSPAASGPEQKTQPAPQNIDPLFWDFGTVAKDSTVKHEFTITNYTKRTLIIKDVVTSCGCTASDVGKKTLAPDEKTKVLVSFNSKGYKGEVTQFVYINTDDQENPVIKLTIRSFVQQ